MQIFFKYKDKNKPFGLLGRTTAKSFPLFFTTNLESFQHNMVKNEGYVQKILFVLFFLLVLQFRRGGVALLRGLESKLSKDLPSDLQKLRCKVPDLDNSPFNCLTVFKMNLEDFPVFFSSVFAFGYIGRSF